ncbi:MAG: SLC13 family permease [Ignisphaera sp.]
MRGVVKIVLLFIVFVISSYIIMKSIVIQSDDIGLNIAGFWCSEIGLSLNSSYCVSLLNSDHYIFIQSLSLSIFMLVVAIIVMHTEWRVAAAILGVVIMILMGIVNPKTFIESVSWDLILFLVGSMAFAGILRELGVFRYLAIQILRLSRFNAYILTAFITIVSFVLSAIVGEVTSIIYVVALIIELKRVLKIEIEPLIILSVLATNTGSVALPIGNPIGVYLLFAAGMSISTFIRYSLPLALINILALYGLYITIANRYLRRCQTLLENYKKSIEAYISSFYTEVYNAKAKRIYLGLLFLTIFVLTVSINDAIVHILSSILQIDISPHSFLSFIPYMYIVLSMMVVVPPEEIGIIIHKTVEWSSIVFFIMLFMLGHALLSTGAIIKMAYILTTISITTAVVLEIVVTISSTILSALLDNLSVVVAFTPMAILFSKSGLTDQLIYFALLFGGVFGGNYTPIGSTANIVALSLAEKKKIRISWRKWLKIALITTTVQIILSILWIYINNVYR